MSEEKITIPEDEIVVRWKDSAGKEHEEFDAERALAQLLLDDQLIVGGLECGTLGVELNVSDMFMWACSEFEPIADCNELRALYERHMKDRKWGTVKWACLKRKEYPQAPVLRDIRKDGLWDLTAEEESTLKPNAYDTAIHSGKSWLDHVEDMQAKEPAHD